MRNLKAVLLLLPLLGCYAQVENPSINLSHNLCGGTTNCMPPNLPAGLIQVSGQNNFSVDFGDQPLLSPSTAVGPTTLKTSLILNGASIQLQNAASGNFKQVTKISLFNAPTSSTDCSTSPASCTLLADFDSTRDGQADQTINLRGANVDLIQFISTLTHSINLQLTAGGTGPGGAWNAEVSMDMALTSRANFP